jgi:hypothetical protein
MYIPANWSGELIVASQSIVQGRQATLLHVESLHDSGVIDETKSAARVDIFVCHCGHDQGDPRDLSNALHVPNLWPVRAFQHILFWIQNHNVN